MLAIGNWIFDSFSQEQHESSKSKLTSKFSGDGASTNGETTNGSSSKNQIESALRTRVCALEELIDTEKAYVSDLALIVDGYIKEIRDADSDIPMPDDLIKDDKWRMVFANVEKIYEWHRE